MSEERAAYAFNAEAAELGTPERWERTMAEIADLLGAELKVVGVTAESDTLAARLACRLCELMGGRQYYIPTGAALERARRDLEIYTTHDGTRVGPRGVQALAQRYRLSEIHVYRILSRQLEMRRKAQGELFE